MEPSKKAQEMQAAYLRAWRSKNRDKTKEYRRRYWERKAAAAESEEAKRSDDNSQTGD